jgi:hypothetical protein
MMNFKLIMAFDCKGSTVARSASEKEKVYNCLSDSGDRSIHVCMAVGKGFTNIQRQRFHW